MKKIQLYYLLAGIVIFLFLLFPNILFPNADSELGPLQRRLLVVFAGCYLSGIVFIFRDFLLHSFKQLPITGYDLGVGIKQLARVHFERFWAFWVSAAIIVFPLAPLFHINGGFSVDWYNHLWMVGYYGEYFSLYKALPDVLNTNQTLLIAYPTFYGYLLYAVLGILSSYTGANIAVRIGILALWIMKFALVYRVVMRFSEDKILSLSIGVLICWEIYSLTNLYNRSALTEMFATGLLTTSFFAGLLALFAHENYHKVGYFFLAGFTISLSGMAHPITAFFGSIFLGIIFLVLILSGVLTNDNSSRVNKTTVLLAAVILFIYILCVLSPWAYATIAFKDQLVIASVFDRVPLFFDGIDNILVRFSPFPFDERSLYEGIHPTWGTPYLDAQVNIPLLILAVMLVLNKKTAKSISVNQNENRIGNLLCWVSVILFLGSTSMSLSSLLYEYIPLFKGVQFAYRMVTYQNLAIITAVISLLLMRRHLNLSTSAKMITFAICLTLAGNGLLMQFWHIQVSANLIPREQQYNSAPQNRDELLNLPYTFYGRHAYTLNRNLFDERLRTLPAMPIVLHLKKNGFGEIERQTFIVSEEMWIQTNVAFSPWNEVLIDGTPAQNTNDINNDDMIDVLVAPGKHHIWARFAPSQTFQLLRLISNFSFTAWTLATITWPLFFLIRNFFLRRQKRILNDTHKQMA